MKIARILLQVNTLHVLSWGICVLQITMTTGWLLLLLLVVSSQSVDSQSTTVNDTRGDEGLSSELRGDAGRILDNQQQLVQEYQRLLHNQQQILNVLQQQQAALNRHSNSMFS